ncbi:VirD4-like conjugal transfer protein, CD1115 family [Enterococcus plantarum]|uniref:VirD4-like conjugal transfer protein, CD1115 family n=1 Tax=Enterococcus plantarum TaxID=1077675 RepID=UPI001A8F6457|nr:type IV secretory system conjugative DNA transfer family protein [Enterococcus plantarum]
MNKLHRQGKAILASIWVRTLFVLFVFLLVTLGINVLINLFHFMQAQLSLVKTLGIGAVGEQLEQARSNWLLFFWFPTIRFSGEGILFPEQLYYVVAYLVTIKKTWRRVYDMERSYENINKGSKGTARWTTQEEMEQQYKKVPLTGRYEGLSGVPVASVPNENAVYVDTSVTNSKAVAETQTGKTQTFSYPLIDIVSRAMIQDSMIVNDIKGNMFRGTRKPLISLGYDVRCFNLLLPDLSMQNNPLEEIKQEYLAGNINRAEKLTKSFTFKIYHNKEAKDPVWQKGAQAVVSAAILAMCRMAKEMNEAKYINIPSVYNFIDVLGELDENGDYLMDRYFANLPVMSPERIQYAIFKKSEIKQRSSFMISVLSELVTFMDSSVAELIVENDFDFRELGFGEKPVALFVIFPDSDDSDYTLLSLFYSSALTMLAQAATKTREGKLPRRVRFIFEEAMNVPAIEGLVRGLNVNLERNIMVHFVYQSEAQVVENYGEQQAAALRAACGNSYYILSQDLDDTEVYTKKLGTSTIITYNRAGDFLDVDKSYTEMEDGRNLLMVDEAMRLREGEWILLRTKHRRDNLGNPITPFPIRANIDDKTEMRFAYTYIPQYFKNDQSLEEIGSQRKNKGEINIEDYILPSNYLEQKILVDEMKEAVSTVEQRGIDINNKMKKKQEEAALKQEAEEKKAMEEQVEVTAEMTAYEATSIYSAWSEEKREKIYEEAERVLPDDQLIALRQFTKVENFDHFIMVNRDTPECQTLFSYILED